MKTGERICAALLGASGTHDRAQGPRGGGQAGPRRARPRRQDRGARAARRGLRGDLHRAAPDARADRGHRRPGGRGRHRAQRALGRPQLPLRARAGAAARRRAPTTSRCSAAASSRRRTSRPSRPWGSRSCSRPGTSTQDIIRFVRENIRAVGLRSPRRAEVEFRSVSAGPSRQDQLARRMRAARVRRARGRAGDPPLRRGATSSRTRSWPSSAAPGSWARWCPRSTAAPALDYVSYALAVEELNRVDASVGITMWAHNSLCTNHIALFGSRGAEGGVPAAPGPRRGAGRVGRSPSPARAPTPPRCASRAVARRRSLRAQRQQGLHHQRGGGGDGGGDGGDRSRRAATRASPPSSSSGARPASAPGKPVPEARPARLQHRRARSSTTCGCPRPTSAASAAWASSTPCRCSRAAASPWPPWRWASPRARSTRRSST